MTFFVNFDLFFGISLIFLLNFADIFAATDIHTYFKIIPIDIFMKTPDDADQKSKFKICTMDVNVI